MSFEDGIFFSDQPKGVILKHAPMKKNQNVFVVFQMSEEDLRKVLREEIEDYFKKNLLFEKAAEVQDIGSVEIAMEITGLSKSRIYQKTSDNSIPHWKKNGKVYFSRSKLLEWIKSEENK